MTAPYADLIERLTLYEHRESYDGKDWEKIASEAAKAIEALQADNDRLQAEVTRLLTAFDGLDLDDKPPQWRIENGEIVPTPENREAALPTPPEGEG